ncbi:MAG: AAA family ATPase, partial [Methanobrevibacter sp.]|nr:AAA family ATPase [Methanobrevibacter sp.]
GLGKTPLVLQLYDYLLNTKRISEKKILYISAEQLKSFFGANLMEAIEIFIEEIHESSLIGLDEKVFILIDEAQEDELWSVCGKVVFDLNPNAFMLFTGSSALDL